MDYSWIAVVNGVLTLATILLYYRNLNLFRAVKLIPILLLIAVSIKIWLDQSQSYPYLLIIAGFAISMAADLLITYKKTFIHALVIFLVSHLLYTVFFILQKAVFSPVFFAVLLLIALMFVFFLYLKMNPEARQKMFLPVVVYIGVLILMSVCGIGYDLIRYQVPFLTAIGVVCYLISDALIAVYVFIRPREILQTPIFIFYFAAQTLIFYSVFVIGHY